MTTLVNKSIQKIVCLLPVFDEAEVLPAMLSRLQQLSRTSAYDIKLLIVDDGSTDASAQIITKYCVENSFCCAVFLSRNFGHSAALTAGLQNIDGEYDAVFILDADLQDPPELLNTFVERMNEGFEVVYGVRKERKDSFLKKLAYKYYYRIQKKITSQSMHLDAGDFCLIHKKVVKVLANMPEESRYLRGMRSWVGFNQSGIEYNRDKRASGKSKYSWSSLFKLAFNGIFNFSEFPVWIISRLGIITIGFSLLYLAILIFKKLVYGTVPVGFTTLITAIVLFSGVQLLCLGIIGEYIMRIFFQVKNRPLYIIKSTIVDGKVENE